MIDDLAVALIYVIFGINVIWAIRRGYRRRKGIK